MAGTTSGRVCNKNDKAAAAVAMAAVALLALLSAAAAAGKTCNVDMGAVLKECRSCSSGPPSEGCCKALEDADFVCLCRDYWKELKQKNEHYASCVRAIPSVCKLPKAKCY